MILKLETDFLRCLFSGGALNAAANPEEINVWSKENIDNWVILEMLIITFLLLITN